MAQPTNQQIFDKLIDHDHQFKTINTKLNDVSEMLKGVGDAVVGIVDDMATKEDLKAFATKEDLKTFATKDDLKQELKAYATKDDVSKMQTTLERRISNSHTVNIRHHLETRAAIGNLTKDLADLQAQ